MFSAAKTLVTTEWRRFVKYAVVGGTLGGVTAGVGGYIVMTNLTQQIEDDFVEQRLPEILFFMRPVATFVLQRLLAKVKKDGVESCMFQGALYGTLSGCSVGVTRIGVGLAYRTLKWIFTRGKVPVK